MAESLKQYVKNKVEGSVVQTDPFSFLYIPNFFPDSFYQQLELVFPIEHQLTGIGDKPHRIVTGRVPGRSTLDIFHMNPVVGYKQIENYPHKKFCIDFQLLASNFLVPLIADKLKISLPECRTDDMRFVLDQEGYFKQPHTDHPKKTMSILIYMSYSSVGTSIFKPKQLAKFDSQGVNHPFNDFVEAFQAPFVPNALLAFERTDTSFHGVKLLNNNEQRKSIQISTWN